MSTFNYIDILKALPLGDIKRSIANNMYGFNHRQTANVVPSNRDIYGYTFFVRPQLNMQATNIRGVRQLLPLLNNNPLSMHTYIRCMLDPRLITGYKLLGGGGEVTADNITGGYSVPPISCPLIDNKQAFIPILTNNLVSLSGFPDLVNPVYVSDAGMYREAHAQVDGIYEYYEAYDITATFRNTRGDPIVYLFYIWELYQSLVFKGTLTPYMDFITENAYDYNTRIYRIVLTQDKTTVSKIAATGVSFPISLPTGSFFDFNSERPYNEQNKDISITFKSLGATFYDEILIKEFNETVCIFNPDMRDNNRESNMIKLLPNVAQLFNNRGYPRIDPETYEFEWWIDRDMYEAVYGAYSGYIKSIINYSNNVLSV